MLMVPPNAHPSTVHIARFFRYEHLPEDNVLRVTSQHVSDLAQWLIDNLPEGPELTAGLRHLLEAKDCFVRQALLITEVLGG